MSLAIGLAAVTAACTARPDVAVACSCEEPSPPVTELEGSDAVFAGRVARVRGAGLFSGESTIVATVQVDEVWKGPVRARLAVTTESDGAACGYPFERGQKVLVYAYEHRGDLETDLCSRTTPLQFAEEDLTALGEGAVPPPDPLVVQAVQRLLDRPLTTGLVLVVLAVAAGLLIRRRRQGGAGTTRAGG